MIVLNFNTNKILVYFQFASIYFFYLIITLSTLLFQSRSKSLTIKQIFESTGVINLPIQIPITPWWKPKPITIEIANPRIEFIVNVTNDTKFYCSNAFKIALFTECKNKKKKFSPI
jgi:hypothetical protein